MREMPNIKSSERA